MADWTDIQNANLEPGAPWISSTCFALRDNVVALAEGAAGAPRIVYAALNLSNDIVNSDIANGTIGAEKFQSGTDERDWVLGRAAGASLNAVGSYATCQWPAGAGSGVPSGTLTAGSNLAFSRSDSATNDGSPTGTWRNMGGDILSNSDGVSLFLRVS